MASTFATDCTKLTSSSEKRTPLCRRRDERPERLTARVDHHGDVAHHPVIAQRGWHLERRIGSHVLHDQRLTGQQGIFLRPAIRGPWVLSAVANHPVSPTGPHSSGRAGAGVLGEASVGAIAEATSTARTEAQTDGGRDPNADPSRRDAERADAPERLAVCYRQRISVDDDELTVGSLTAERELPPLT